ncbi:hypothetical protein J6524_18400 [Bradyrhizobium sp. WSM 1738]|uniref:hypothetical protein n=1 Tax=Bradyrhizobium hereditatis TaxID=2821405 RepID=UPI001CE2C543|nr:hypothetical protein [Bradyrhizobium hereditatis]MCA6116846.1 hypothetical protein [Bradyrhizobium hereditatis]
MALLELAYPAALQAEGVDSCNAILSDALLTKRVGANDRSYQAAEHYGRAAPTAAKFSATFKCQKPGKLGLAKAVGTRVSLYQGSHSTLVADHSNTDEIDAWKRLNCLRTDRQQNETAAGSLSEQYLGPGVAENWAKCIASRDGLQCTGRRQKAGINSTVSYHSYKVALPVITEFTVHTGEVQGSIPCASTIKPFNDLMV